MILNYRSGPKYYIHMGHCERKTGRLDSERKMGICCIAGFENEKQSHESGNAGSVDKMENTTKGIIPGDLPECMQHCQCWNA